MLIFSNSISTTRSNKWNEFTLNTFENSVNEFYLEWTFDPRCQIFMSNFSTCAFMAMEFVFPRTNANTFLVVLNTINLNK